MCKFFIHSCVFRSKLFYQIFWYTANYVQNGGFTHLPLTQKMLGFIG